MIFKVCSDHSGTLREQLFGMRRKTMGITIFTQDLMTHCAGTVSRLEG